jgi:hypothetical protein
LTKPEPLTVSVKSAAGAVALAGERPPSWLMAGAGLLTVKTAGAEVVPEVTTVTLAVPAAATFAAGTSAVNCVAPT